MRPARLVPIITITPPINLKNATAVIKNNPVFAYAKKFAPIPLPAVFLPTARRLKKPAPPAELPLKS